MKLFGSADNLTYHYLVDGSGNLLQNRLYHVNDAIAGAAYVGDLEDQGAFDAVNVETNNNYKYDQEGRLIQDLAEGIQEIVWRVDGKVKAVYFTTASEKNNLEFDYDAFGRRIAKHVYLQDNSLVRSTYYILDAQGNQLSTYEHVLDNQESNYELAERVMYGSSRLGINVNKVDMLDENPEDVISLSLGNKLYEMSNHLGNILTVINDIKVPQSSNTVDVDSYLATIVSTADYSPFGVQLDGRTVSSESYRWGYQGSEKDDEVKGDGNGYTTMFRQLDPRVGRWLSIDPLAAQFPWQSPYVSMDNNPICLNDIYGLSTNNQNNGNNNAPSTTQFLGPDRKNLVLPNCATKIIGHYETRQVPVAIPSDYSNTQTCNAPNSPTTGIVTETVFIVESFEIEGVTYTANYRKGKFNGYWNSSGGKFGGTDSFGNYRGNSYESRTDNVISQSDVDKYIKNRFAKDKYDDIPIDDSFTEDLAVDMLRQTLEDVLGDILPVSLGPGGIPDPENSPRRQKLYIRYYLQHVAGPGSQCTHITTQVGFDGNCMFTITTYTVIQYFGTNSQGDPVFKQNSFTVDSRKPQMAKK